jgi:hypothetical protein
MRASEIACIAEDGLKPALGQADVRMPSFVPMRTGSLSTAGSAAKGELNMRRTGHIRERSPGAFEIR